jgi:hypothetical protein
VINTDVPLTQLRADVAAQLASLEKDFFK